MAGSTKMSYSIQSVDNALRLLELLSEENGEVRLTHLSEKMAMNKANVFRLLATFEQRGFVERSEHPGKYRLGHAAFEIGQKMLLRMDLLRKAKPIMEQLAREFNEAIYLAILRKREILMLEMVGSAQQVGIVPLVGRRYHLHEIAAGKLFLAFNGTEMSTSPGEARLLVETERDHIRRRGGCLDRDALGEGIVSLAVPIFNKDGRIIGSLCLVGPNFRLTDELLENFFFPPLRTAGQVISSRLGFF